LSVLWVVLACAGAYAATDANRATVAELEALTGIGPDLAARVIDERRKAPFAGWADLMARVRGVGPKVAARLSEQGLRIDDAPYTATAVPRPVAAPAASGSAR
jgi:competence protein ComEA